MSAQRVIALLGRRDEPTDAVEDYCRYLGEALVGRDFNSGFVSTNPETRFQLEIHRVPWNQHGWGASLNALRLQAEAWRGTWVLVQYTALAWSARGFPRRFLNVLRVLRKAGAKIVIVYHDAQPFGGARLIDRVRRGSQVRVMRTAFDWCDHAVLTVPADRIAWLASDAAAKSSFIPVGANLPSDAAGQSHEALHSPPTVGVFSITGGAAGDRETQDIVAAMRLASQKLGQLKLLVFGRYAETREAALREGLRDLPVELAVEGVLDDAQIVQRLAASDVLLFVRGTISSRRGSAIAGITCGLPVIALAGPETAPPITDAGVILLSSDLDSAALQQKLAEALVQIASDNAFRLQLVQRSQQAQRDFFSWPAIAARYVSFLR